MAERDTTEPRALTIEQALGIDGLTNVDAALACRCSCHTRVFGRPTHVRPDGTSPYDPDGVLADQEPLHDDGASCPCQLTPEQRAQGWQQLQATLAELHDAPAARRLAAAQQADLVAARALGQRWGIEQVAVTCWGFPLIVEAVGPHGQQLWLRERHGSWRLEVDGEVVARGDAQDLGGEGAAALGPRGAEGESDEFEVDTVQRAVALMAQQLDRLGSAGCSHRGARAFCPDCGSWTG